MGIGETVPAWKTKTASANKSKSGREMLARARRDNEEDHEQAACMAKIAKSEYHCLLFLLYRSRLAGNLKSRWTATRDESWSCDEWISISVLLAIPFRYCTKLPRRSILSPIARTVGKVQWIAAGDVCHDWRRLKHSIDIAIRRDIQDPGEFRSLHVQSALLPKHAQRKAVSVCFSAGACMAVATLQGIHSG